MIIEKISWVKTQNELVPVTPQDVESRMIILLKQPVLIDSAVAEAIANAVAHRDYTSNGSVQVMLFRDRLEVWTLGRLPDGFTIQKLHEVHSSEPTNPVIAHPLFLTGYIEHLGTGTTDMIVDCAEYGLRTPEFIQAEDFRTIIWRNEKVSDSSPEVSYLDEKVSKHLAKMIVKR